MNCAAPEAAATAAAASGEQVGAVQGTWCSIPFAAAPRVRTTCVPSVPSRPRNGGSSSMFTRGRERERERRLHAKTPRSSRRERERKKERSRRDRFAVCRRYYSIIPSVIRTPHAASRMLNTIRVDPSTRARVPRTRDFGRYPRCPITRNRWGFRAFTARDARRRDSKVKSVVRRP